MNMMNADTEGHIASFVVGEKAMPVYRSLAEQMGFADAGFAQLAVMEAKNGALDELERFIEETPGVESDGNILTRRILDTILRNPQVIRKHIALCSWQTAYKCNFHVQTLPRMTVGELKRHCKMNGIKRYSRLRRHELIQALLKL